MVVHPVNATCGGEIARFLLSGCLGVPVGGSGIAGLRPLEGPSCKHVSGVYTRVRGVTAVVYTQRIHRLVHSLVILQTTSQL